MSTQLQGRVAPIGQQYDNTPLDILQTNLGSTRVGQTEPDYFEMARRGWLFGVHHTVATAIAPVQVISTTTAPFVLNNVDTSGNVIVPLLVGVMLGSGTAGLGLTLCAGVTNGAVTTQLSADGTGVVHKCLRDQGNTPTAFADFAKTIPAGSVFNNIGGMQNAAAAVVGSGFTVDLRGMYVIKPTYGFCLSILSGAGTSPLFTLSVIYARIPSLTP